MELTANDLALLKSMNEGGMTPYESVKLDYMAAKSHTGGVAIAGLVTGVVGTAIGVGAWLFGGMQASAKGKEAKEAAIAAKEIAAAKFDAVGTQLAQLTNLFAAERQERIEGDKTLSISINDTVSGQQSGQLTASQIAQLEQSQQLQLGLMTGKYSENPTKVQIYSAPQPCGCPGCQG
jgi:uncharacterized protein HemX